MALIDYFRSYIDVDIIKEMEDIAKNIGDLQQKFIENTGIPRNRLGIDLGDPEGDIGTETVSDIDDIPSVTPFMKAEMEYYN